MACYVINQWGVTMFARFSVQVDMPGVSLVYRITVFTSSGLYSGLVAATLAVPAARQVSQAANTTVATRKKSST